MAEEKAVGRNSKVTDLETNLASASSGVDVANVPSAAGSDETNTETNLEELEEGEQDYPDRDFDSAYGDSEFASETASLNSDITRYREENGRTYHSYGSTEHWGPNDQQARDQQDFSHHFWTLVLEDKFFLAPVKNPQKILDLGTGTGIWVMDVADRYPTSHVKGMDLSPIQPVWTPPNAIFEIDDYNLPNWDETPNNYDLIHMRELLGSVRSWPFLFKKCFEALRPGGWIDCAEPDINVTSQYVELGEDDTNRLWVRLFREVSRKTGMTFEPIPMLKRWLEDAGFVNVVERVEHVPVGTWREDAKGKNLGLWNQIRLAMGMRDFTERRMRNFMGWDDQEIMVLVAKGRAEVQNSKLCTQQDMYFIYGQKPKIS